jgi:hypothetical protein
VIAGLPFSMPVTHVQLITGNFDGRPFRPLADFALGAAGAG